MGLRARALGAGHQTCGWRCGYICLWWSMWLGRKGDIPFGRLPRVLPTMQKTFPKLCHSLLQVVPQSDLQPPPKVYIPPSQPVGLEGTGVSALGACASPPALTPSPHYDLSYANNSGPHDLDLLLGSSAATKPGSTVGSVPDCQSSSSGFKPCLRHHLPTSQNMDSWPYEPHTPGFRLIGTRH